MAITPLDIKKQPFPRVWLRRGFDPDEVNAFLLHISEEFAALIRQNDAYATQVKHLEQQLSKYTNIEQVLNETLITAQKSTDLAKANAQKEAELIINDAEARAERYEAEARQRVNRLDNEVIAIRNQRDSFLARFKSMLKTQLDLLEVISGDLRGDDGRQDQPEQKHRQEPHSQSRQQQAKPQRSVMMKGGFAADDDTIDDVPPQPVIIG